MNSREVLQFAAQSLNGNRLRTALIMLAMAIGVASVLLLTALGEGARRYVVNQFASVGNNLLIVFPGRTESAGIDANMLLGQIPRELTLADANALLHSRYVKQMAPLIIGAAEVSYQALNRQVVVMGTNAAFLTLRHMEMQQGRFLPSEDSAQAVCVLGSSIKQTLLGAASAVGQQIRLGDRRCRVIGVLAEQGQSMGFDTDELVIVPVISAQRLFDREGLLRILVEASHRQALQPAQQDIEQLLMQRHHGERDVTVVTQDAVLQTFDRILTTLTMALAGIAAISLVVAGVLVMNVMLIAVAQRVGEIGLLKAMGASAGRIRGLFFVEAALLSLLGCISGLVIGQLAVWGLAAAYPLVPLAIPGWAILAASMTAMLTGILFSVWPARQAAALDPVKALGRS